MSREKGLLTEKQACYYLQQKGLRLVEQNYWCRYGELDLIMIDDQSLVFVEVKFRRPSNFADGVESITKAKKRKIITTAIHYIQSHSWSDDYDYRFDVVVVSPSNRRKTLNVDWIPAAFESDQFFSPI